MTKYTSTVDNTNRPFAYDHNEKNVTSFGGLPGIMRNMRDGGFSDGIASVLESFVPRPHPLFRYNSKEVIEQLMTAIFVGCPDFSEIKMLAKDELFKRVMPNQSIASASTLSRFFDRVEKVCQFLQNQALIDADRTFDSLGKTDPIRVTNKLFEALNKQTLSQAIRLLHKQGGNETIIVDVDSTPVELSGSQREGFFDAHYGVTSYLPILVLFNGIPAFVQNAPGAANGAKLLLIHVKSILQTLKEAFPQATIVVRGDTGYNNDALIEAIKAEGCKFLFGCNVAANRMKTELINEILTFAAADTYGTVFVPADVISKLLPIGGLWGTEICEPGARCKATSTTTDGKFRACGYLRDYKAKSWTSARILAYRLQYSPTFKDIDIRFIQTNLTPAEALRLGGGRGVSKNRALPSETFEPTEEFATAAIELYEALFSDRGQAERVNTEWKTHCCAARCSLQGFFANSLRMVIALTSLQVFEEYRIKLRRKEQPHKSNTIRRSNKPNRTRAHCAAMRRSGPSVETIRRRIICVPATVRVLATRVHVSTQPLSEIWENRFNVLLE